MRPYVVACVFARGGSKGVPRKNLRPLNGVPLVGLAIRHALASEHVDRVIVSTDDPEIAEVARHHGAEVPWMRPADLAADDAPEWLAWRHMIHCLTEEGRAPDLLVAVPATAPLRSVADVDACIHTALTTDADVVLVVTPSHRNPWFNMVRLDPSGEVHLVNQGGGFFRRQDTPPVYDVTTVAFAARPAFVLSANGIYEGRVRAVEVPAERALDIDTELDLRMAECLSASDQGEPR
jgi:CMP-N-acetylneuraminic acid synthetase